ncbi:MAG: deoxyribodipyrimidine photolyase, partial [Kofleriaceae bacterium]
LARGTHVLYWMIAARRTRHNFALDHAIARATELSLPLLVFEPLRVGYHWASDRFHTFVLQGMADNARAFARAGITYLPYVEPAAGAGSGLLAALAKRAAVVVTDEQPAFFLPAMVAAAAAKLETRIEQVDGNGILPLRAADAEFSTAIAFRRHLQRVGLPYLTSFPRPRPLVRLPASIRDAELPTAISRKWPSASEALLAAEPGALATLPIDHAVAPVAYRGGAEAGEAVLATFVANRLPRYGEGRNHPDDDASSGLSPYLHFGHVGAHDVVARVWNTEAWEPSRVAGAKVTGSKTGWWGMSAAAEAFLDEVIVWRELGYGFCFHRKDHARYASLPQWARDTLAAHAGDPRPHLYTRTQLATAATADPIWNAAQRQLLAEGRIHNYLRMLWGKKILEWSASPQAALATLIELNNKYAVDGRDPSSYSGIFWTLGRFDRPWGRRPIFGMIRYMSSEATRRKLDLDDYLRRWS